MRRIILNITLCTFLLLVIPLSASDKDIPAVSSGDLLYYFDHTSFMGNDESAYVEFYVMIYADQLTQINQNDKSYSIIKITFSVNDLASNEIVSRTWETEATIKNDTDIRTQILYDKWAEQINNGTYKVSLQISDTKSKNTGVIEKQIEISSFDVDNLGISNIKYFNGIRNNNEGSISEQILNPSRRYGLLNPNIYFYYELYTTELNPQRTLYPTYIIEKVNDDYSKRIVDNELILSSRSIGLSRAIDVSKLSSGLYNLTVKISSDEAETICNVSRMFEVIQADYFENIPMLTDDELSPLENILKYIGTTRQVRLFNKLDRVSKTIFLIQFFKDVNAGNLYDQQKYVEMLYQYYNYANEKFGWGKVEGWVTDRGRILIQNGFPDEIERHYFEENSKPYEIWFYRSAKQYYYIFGDVYTSGKFILLHSNKESEVYNASWKRELDSIK